MNKTEKNNFINNALIEYLEMASGVSSSEFKKNKDNLKRELKKLSVKSFNKEQVEIISNFIFESKKLNPKNLVVFTTALKGIIFKIKRSQSHIFIDFIVDNIQNKNGNVRQSTVNFYNWWAIVTDDPLGPNRQNKLNKNLYSLFSQIKELIKKHQPNGIVISDNFLDNPTYLNELSPSVYKSLVSLWENATGSYYMENVLKNYPELKIKIPVRNYEDEEWVEENEIDPEEEASNLWNKQKPDIEVLSALSILETLAKKSFEKELEKFNFEKKFSNSLIDELKNNFGFGGGCMIIFDKMVANYLKRGINPNDTDSLVRALLFFSGHHIIENDKKEPMSQVVLASVIQREEAMGNEPKDMKSFILRLKDAHLSIDDFYKKGLENQKRKQKEFMKGVEENEPEMGCELRDTLNNHLNEIIDSFEQCNSIAHHSLDWFVQIEPWSVLSKSPKKLAALAYFTVRKFNYENKGGIAPYETSDLSEYGGWKSNSISSSSSRFFYAVVTAVRDPRLLLILNDDNKNNEI